jgi:serine protease Do
MHELPKMVAHTAPGQNANLKVLRNGKEKNFTVTIAEMKPEHMSRFMEQQPEGEAEKSKLGLTVQELNPNIARNFQIKETSGMIVVQVEQGTPAADAGIRPGDIIEEINSIPIKTMKDYQANISQAKAGSALRFLVKRQGKTLYVVVEVPEKE